MTWNDAEKYMEPLFVPLTNDGDNATCTLLDEPTVVETTSFGQKRIRFAFPVFDGVSAKILMLPRRTAYQLSLIRDKLLHEPFYVVRHGDKGSTETAYNITLLPEQDEIDTINAVFDGVKSVFTSDFLNDLKRKALSAGNLTIISEDLGV